MAEKELTEASWKAFDKDKKYKSDALLKAMRILTTLEKGGQGLGAEKLKALKDIEDEADALRKANKDAKELGPQLKKIEEAVTRQRKETEREMREEAQAQEEEADSPVLLGKKMVPLLRELRKGEARMNAMICTAGKNTAVLIMRRAISPSRFKLLTEYVDAAGGAKKIVGECVFEAGALTFIVQSPAGGLAKRLRQALLAQTELKFKVKVRGEDGAEDNDGEDGAEGDEGEGEQPGTAGEVKPPAPPGSPASAEALAYTQWLRKLTPRYDDARGAKHPELNKLTALMGMASERANKEPPDHAGAIKALMGVEKLLDAPLPTQAGGVDPDAAFNARLAALLPRIKAALATAAPAAQDIKLRASEAGALARQRDHAGANAVLDLVEKLLGELQGAPDGTNAVPPANVNALPAELASLVRQIPGIACTQPQRLESLKALAGKAAAVLKSGDAAAAAAAVQALREAVALAPAKTRRPASSAELTAIWREAKEGADERMSALRASVLAHPDPALKATLAQIADKALSGLGGVTAGATVGMMAAMMDVENAPAQARQAVEKFRAFLASDIARGIDENPFQVQVDLRRTLGAALEQIESRLAA